MHRVTEIVPADRADAARAGATLTLSHGERHLRRKVIALGDGTDILIDLPDARQLCHGDQLIIEDGRAVAIAAADEPLMEVTTSGHPSLAVLAWQIGNRHLAAEIRADRILLERDHVIREMLTGLGATVSDVDAPFHPEAGAYARGHHHGAHKHAHD
ncbi:MAG: urease accessory protein UreE [Pseudomonadota bacterium]